MFYNFGSGLDANIISAAQQFVTISTLYDGLTAATSTSLPAAPAQIGTVFVQVPRQYTTISTLYAGAVTTTVTTFTPTVVGQTGTVFVFSPQAYTTTTSFYSGSTTSIATIAPAILGQPATVVIYSPQVYTTVTSFYAGSTIITSTVVVPTLPGQTGTVVVEVPTTLSSSFTTINRGTAFTSTVTSVVSAGLLTSATTTTYVLIGVPTVYSTVTITSGSVATTTTVISASTTFVHAFAPTPTLSTSTTLTVGGTAFTSTVTSIIPTGPLTPATITTYVLVAVPAILSFTTVTTLYAGTVPTTTTEFIPTVPLQTGTVVVVVASPRTYSTTTSGWTSTSIITTTLFTPTAVGQTEIVRVQTPVVSYTTITRCGPGPVIKTITQSPTNGGTLGSFVVETLASFVTTILDQGYSAFQATNTTVYPTTPLGTGIVLSLIPNYQATPSARAITTITSTIRAGPVSCTLVNSVFPGGNGQTGTFSIISATPIPLTTIYTTSGSIRTTSTSSADLAGTVTVRVILPTLTAPFIGPTITETRGYSGMSITSFILYPTGTGNTASLFILTSDTRSTKTVYSGMGPLPTTVTTTTVVGTSTSPIVEVILPACTNIGLRY
jgi:hypothetical protein